MSEFFKRAFVPRILALVLHQVLWCHLMPILVTAIIFMNTYVEQFFDGAFHNLFISDIKVDYDAFLILGFYPVFCHFKKRHEKLIQQVF